MIQVDPYIVSIEGHSGQVALYKFNGGKQDWEKTQVEGTLFVYQREADPQYGFTIMNRLSMNNLVEPVTKDLDFQLQTPFLLYRNHANDIFGIWFYEQAECERVGKKIEELVKVVTEEKKMKQQGNGNGKGGNLQQLFKKAEASKTKENPSGHSDASGKNLLRLLSGQDGVAGSQPQPLMEGITPTSGPEKASNSVQDFFAKAAVSSSDTSSAFTSVPAMFSAPPLPNGVPITAMPISQGLAMGAVPVGGYQMLPPPGVAGPANPLQRLMSNPGIHSVESIEAEQRKSASPSQEQQQVNNLPPGLSIPPNKINALESDLKQKLHIGSSVTINNNSINHSFAPVKVKELQEEEESRGVKLLSPQAFSSGRPTQSPSPSLLRNGVSPPTSSQVTPLTQPQLVEAITFLMENDQEFVQKIHQVPQGSDCVLPANDALFPGLRDVTEQEVGDNEVSDSLWPVAV